MNKNDIIRELEASLTSINHNLTKTRSSQEIQASLYNAKVNALAALLNASAGDTFEGDYVEVEDATLVRLGKANMGLVSANSNYDIDQLRQMLDATKKTGMTLYFRIPRATTSR